jgi:hypothetical protein
MKTILALLTFVAAMCAARQSAADDLTANAEAANLAREAARDYDILAPSLRLAAESVISEIDKFNERANTRPVIDWTTDLSDREEFLTPRNVHVAVNTTVVYTVSVSQRTFHYEISGVKRIVRTGMRATPFAGSVEFRVICMARTLEKELTESLPIPEHYRPFPRDVPVVELVQEIEEAEPLSLAPFEYPPKFPLPYGPQAWIRKEPMPTLISDAADGLRKRCIQAEPETIKETRLVWFDYHLEEKRWRCRTEE